MNTLAHRPRFSPLRRMALSLLLGMALLAPVEAVALTIIKVTTIYYVFGVEVWRTVETIVVNET